MLEAELAANDARIAALANEYHQQIAAKGGRAEQTEHAEKGEKAGEK
jgi:hypothetical protein